jgi:hypothetical protein
VKPLEGGLHFYFNCGLCDGRLQMIEDEVKIKKDPNETRSGGLWCSDMPWI